MEFCRRFCEEAVKRKQGKRKMFGKRETLPGVGLYLDGGFGVGKTHLARALAGEAGVPLFAVSGAEFEEVYVGVGAARVRALFGAARARGRAIIFIDEIDAIAGSRARGAGTTGTVRQTLNQLLVEMDGFRTGEGVVVLCATNAREELDAALLRPGRVDAAFTMHLPDVQGRTAILRALLATVPGGRLDAGVSAEALARRTTGYSGAQLAQLVNRAKLLAAQDPACAHVAAHHVDEAFLFVESGPARALLRDPRDRARTAHHEAGHALAAFLLPHAHVPAMASIVPRGNALGAVYLAHEGDRTPSRAEAEATVRVLLGGFAGEAELAGGAGVSFGPEQDLAGADRLARAMVRAGFGARTGLLRPGPEASPAALQDVEQDVRGILDDAMRDVTALIRRHRGAWLALAAALLERETLNQAEMLAILAAHGATPASASASVSVSSSVLSSSSGVLIEAAAILPSTNVTTPASSSSPSPATSSHNSPCSSRRWRASNSGGV